MKKRHCIGAIYAALRHFGVTADEVGGIVHGYKTWLQAPDQTENARDYRFVYYHNGVLYAMPCLIEELKNKFVGIEHSSVVFLHVRHDGIKVGDTVKAKIIKINVDGIKVDVNGMTTFICNEDLSENSRRLNTLNKFVYEVGGVVYAKVTYIDRRANLIRLSVEEHEKDRQKLASGHRPDDECSNQYRKASAIDNELRLIKAELFGHTDIALALPTQEELATMADHMSGKALDKAYDKNLHQIVHLWHDDVWVAPDENHTERFAVDLSNTLLALSEQQETALVQPIVRLRKDIDFSGKMTYYGVFDEDTLKAYKTLLEG